MEQEQRLQREKIGARAETGKMWSKSKDRRRITMGQEQGQKREKFKVRAETEEL